jgi:hypothetical protein
MYKNPVDATITKLRIALRNIKRRIYKFMKVKELIEELSLVDPEAIVLIPQNDIALMDTQPYISVNSVASGFNEYDGAIFLEYYIEDDSETESEWDGWGYLIGNSSDHPSFFKTNNIIEALISYAQYCHGSNDIFEKAIRSMSNMNDALELYNMIYDFDRPDLIIKCHRSQIKKWCVSDLDAEESI